MRNRIKIFAPLMAGALAAFACGEKPQKADSATALQIRERGHVSEMPTLIRTTANNKIVPAECLIDDGSSLSQIFTPDYLSLPVSLSKPLSKVVVTCAYEGSTRSAILRSRPVRTHDQTVLDVSEGDPIYINDVRNGNGGNVIGMTDALALGFSTRFAIDNFYTYPDLVVLRF